MLYHWLLSTRASSSAPKSKHAHERWSYCAKHGGRCRQQGSASGTHRGDDTVGLALPVGNVAGGLNDDVARLAGGLRPGDFLHTHYLALERLLGAEGVERQVAIL